jgi:hypothetical protein
MAEAMLGRLVRCFACEHRFVATPGPLPRPGRGRGEAAPPPPRPPEPRREDDEDEAAEDRRPFCPGCGRRISWEAVVCPHCGEEFEPEDEARGRKRRLITRVRRDCEPHRGRLIAGLGNFSLIVGGLSLCLFGVGALVSVPVGVAAWVMANHDLAQMRAGAMDPRGKAQTENGRTGAIVGVVLSLLFASFYAMLYLGRW